MRLALALLWVGLLLAACSDDDAMSATPDAQPPTSGQGGSGTAGTTGGVGGMLSPPDGGRSGGRPDASAGRGGGGVVTGGPDGGPDGGTAVFSNHLIAQGMDGCVLTRDGTPQCWDMFGSAVVSPFVGTFVSVYGGPVDQYRRLCMLDSAGGYSCEGGAARPPPGFPVTDMAIGNAISCGLQPDQTIVCWDGGLTTLAAMDFPVPSGSFVQIGAGTDVFCGLRADGTGECWGDSAAEYAFPADERFVQFSIGLRLACGVTAAGAVECWGANTAELVQPPPTSGARSVHVGGGMGCALMEDGRARWFGNPAGFNLEPPELLFRELASGYRSICGIASDGLVWCWDGSLSRQMMDQAGNPLVARDP